MDFVWCVAGFTFYLVVVLNFSVVIFLLLPVDSISSQEHTGAVQWETGKVLLKIEFTTDIIGRSLCEGGDHELTLDGVGTPAAHFETWETVRQMAVSVQLCTKARAAKCQEIFI